MQKDRLLDLNINTYLKTEINLQNIIKCMHLHRDKRNLHEIV